MAAKKKSKRASKPKAKNALRDPRRGKKAAGARKKKRSIKAKSSAARRPAARKKKPAAARRATPKVSPIRGMSVDDWSKKLTGWQADALRLVRAIVARHAPDATLSIKWGQPVWEKNGPLAWARPAKEHFSFGFWRGAELTDSANVLEGDGDRMRHVKLTSAEDVDRMPLGDLVSEAVRLNETHGDPTKRP
jgi:hypothetical protein